MSLVPYDKSSSSRDVDRVSWQAHQLELESGWQVDWCMLKSQGVLVPVIQRGSSLVRRGLQGWRRKRPHHGNLQLVSNCPGSQHWQRSRSSPRTRPVPHNNQHPLTLNNPIHVDAFISIYSNELRSCGVWGALLVEVVIWTKLGKAIDKWE
jgi:hypothetical protein